MEFYFFVVRADSTLYMAFSTVACRYVTCGFGLVPASRNLISLSLSLFRGLCEQSKFVEELAQQGRIRELILDQYANYVVQRALTVANNEEGLKLVAAIRPHLHSMQVQ